VTIWKQRAGDWSRSSTPQSALVLDYLDHDALSGTVCHGHRTSEVTALTEQREARDIGAKYLLIAPPFASTDLVKERISLPLQQRLNPER